MGRAVCPAKYILEDILQAVTAEILGQESFEASVFAERITEIRVPEAGRLTFVFTDGSNTERLWYNRSRCESWTPEMKQV